MSQQDGSAYAELKKRKQIQSSLKTSELEESRSSSLCSRDQFKSNTLIGSVESNFKVIKDSQESKTAVDRYKDIGLDHNFDWIFGVLKSLSQSEDTFYATYVRQKIEK